MGALVAEIKSPTVILCRSTTSCAIVAGKCTAKGARNTKIQTIVRDHLAESVKAAFSG
jgi:hypothetical protein